VEKTLEVAGTRVARIGLGTNRLARKQQNVAFVREAIEAGVGLIDTAHLYTGGESEATIGEALSPRPEGVVIATKGGFRPGQGSREVLREQIEESLRRLRTDHIQLYYLHRVDPETPLEASLAAIKEYQEAGKIGQVGLSEVGTAEIERAREVVEVAAVQNQYNIAERKWDHVVDYCAREGIVFVPYYPLRGGDGGRPVAKIAKTHGATPSQVLLAWLLRRSPTTLPIPGTLSLAHLTENLAALELELSDDELEALT